MSAQVGPSFLVFMAWVVAILAVFFVVGFVLHNELWTRLGRAELAQKRVIDRRAAELVRAGHDPYAALNRATWEIRDEARKLDALLESEGLS